jgi:peptidoglycan/LPS O-acetylase OafA/YrhL
MKEEIRPLTGLRGIASLWVLLHHCESFFLPVATQSSTAKFLSCAFVGGYLGVDLFFVLSGYVLAYNYANIRWDRHTYFAFIKKRFARIYPVHLVTMIFIGALALVPGFWRGLLPQLITFEGAIRSLTLTSAWTTDDWRTWNTPAWSLSCEWLAYLLFPLVAAATHRLRSLPWPLIAIGCLYVALAVAADPTAHAEQQQFALERIAINFTAGAILFRVPAHSNQQWLAVISISLLIVGASIVEVKMWHGAALQIVPVLTCVSVFSLATHTGPIQSALSSRISMSLGRASFALYLVHFPVIMLVRLSLGEPDTVAEATTRAVMALSISIVLSFAIYHLVEEPARQWIMRSNASAATAATTQNPAARA